MKDMPKTRQVVPVRQTMGFYLKATAKYPLDSALASLLPVSSTLLSVVTPFFASKVLADIVTKNDQVWPNFWWFTMSAVFSLLLNIVGIRRCMALQAKVMEDLHRLAFERLLQRSVGFYSNQIGGKLVSDVMDFVVSYGQLFNAGFIGAFSFALTVFVGLVVVSISNILIGAALTVLLLVLVFWTISSTRSRSEKRSRRLIISKRLVAHLSDSIANAVTVKTFAQENTEIATNREINEKLGKARMNDWLHTVTNENERVGVLLLMQIVLLLVLIKITAHKPHLLATGIFAFTYTLTLISRFFTINTMARQIEEAFLQASPMIELLNEPIEVVDRPNATALVVKAGEIQCRNVSFHYPDSDTNDNVFENLNLVIEPGQKIGLVGHSGGGKTTLTRLMLRFDDITAGSICIDGQDLKDVTQVSLREQISYVPQEPLLFHRSIEENIAYGMPAASQASIEAAAKKAFAHDFIERLPHSYETMVGERGVKLSGGQRQRIAIARAILKNSPILILDEATSALDSESEKVIQEALWKLMEGKTAIVIAHRLSTIQRLDRIVVLDDGKIVEDGTHKELLKRKGLYAKLWAHQSGGFIEE